MWGASNKASGPAGCSPEGRGGGRASALLPILDDVRHRLRRGASHLPARRSRQSVHIISSQTLNPAQDATRTARALEDIQRLAGGEIRVRWLEVFRSLDGALCNDQLGFQSIP